MGAILPAQGVISYNGVVFGPETETLGYEVKPIMDSARRTVKCVEYSLKLRTTIAIKSGDGLTSIDTTMEGVRRLLTQNGGQFYYTSKGFGTITINVAGGARDVNWGPITTLIGFKPLGANLAAEVIWGVTYQTLDCTNALFRFGVMEFNWKVEFTLGRDRMTNRVCSGFLQIPQTLVAAGNKRLTDSADLYYELCAVEIPYGHRRENEKRTLNEAKTRLDFSFTDMRLKSPLPWGVVEMTEDHEQHNDPARQFYQKLGRISATYEMALHIPLEVAEMHFHRLWLDRRAALLDSGKFFNTFIPQVISFRESITRRTVVASMTYKFVQGRPPPPGPGQKPLPGNPIIGTQGFWRPVIDGKLSEDNGVGVQQFQTPADHARWAQSMQYATVLRGYTQDIINPSDDAIIDLCKSGPPTLGTSTYSPSIQPFESDPRDNQEEIPEPQDSWVDWLCRIYVSTDDGMAIIKPLPQTKLPDPNAGPPSLVDQIESGDGFVPVLPGESSSDNPVILQRRTNPVVYVWLVGYAMRTAYQIGEPTLLSVGGVPAYPVNREELEYFSSEQIGAYGLPVYQARWCSRYVLMRTPRLPTETPIGPFDAAEPIIGDPSLRESV